MVQAGVKVLTGNSWPTAQAFSGLGGQGGACPAHAAHRQALPRSGSGTRARASKLTAVSEHQQSTSNVPDMARTHWFGLPHRGQVWLGNECMMAGHVGIVNLNPHHNESQLRTQRTVLQEHANHAPMGCIDAIECQPFQANMQQRQYAVASSVDVTTLDRIASFSLTGARGLI